MPPKKHEFITGSDPLKGFQHFVEIIPQRVQDVLKENVFVCVLGEAFTLPNTVYPHLTGHSF